MKTILFRTWLVLCIVFFLAIFRIWTILVSVVFVARGDEDNARWDSFIPTRDDWEDYL